MLCTGDFLQESRNPISGESALSRHFIWLFLAMSVEISGPPVQLFFIAYGCEVYSIRHNLILYV